MPADRDDDERAARLWDAVDEEFLAVMGWDPDRQVVTFPQDAPAARLDKVPGSRLREGGRSGRRTLRCLRAPAGGRRRYPFADFIAMPKPAQRCIGVVPCAVGGCERPAKTTARGCAMRTTTSGRAFIGLPLEEFLAHPGVVPLASFGPCTVAACTRDRVGRGPYCHQHAQRLRLAKKKNPGLDVEAWQRTVPAVAEGSQVSLRGLPPLVVAEVLYGVQERTRSDIKTSHLYLRPLCDLLRATRSRVRRGPDLGQGDPAREGAGEGASPSRCAAWRLSPETERHKDVWDLFVFGHGGSLTFTAISQPWLREAVKRWAFDDLPRRRGDQRRERGPAEDQLDRAAVGEPAPAARRPRRRHQRAGPRGHHRVLQPDGLPRRARDRSAATPG